MRIASNVFVNGFFTYWSVVPCSLVNCNWASGIGGWVQLRQEVPANGWPHKAGTCEANPDGVYSHDISLFYMLLLLNGHLVV